jgi:hypothetical protein
MKWDVKYISPPLFFKPISINFLLETPTDLIIFLNILKNSHDILDPLITDLYFKLERYRDTLPLSTEEDTNVEN